MNCLGNMTKSLKRVQKCFSDLVFWINGSADLHGIVNLPNSFDKLLQEGEQRAFNFFESMYPLYIRIEAENGLHAAF